MAVRPDYNEDLSSQSVTNLDQPGQQEKTFLSTQEGKRPFIDGFRQ